MGTVLPGQGKRARKKSGRAASETSLGTATDPFVENTKQGANGDALIHEACLLQVLRQAHSHQLQQVRVSQLAAKEKKLQRRKREEGHDF